MIDNNPCRDVRRLIDRSASGKEPLAPREAETVKSHLASCADCRAYAEAAGALEEKIRASASEPPADLHESIMKAVRAEKAAQLRRRRGTRARMGVLASAAVFVLMSVLTVSTLLPLLSRVDEDSGNGMVLTESVYNQNHFSSVEAEGEKIPNNSDISDDSPEGLIGSGIKDQLPENVPGAVDSSVSVPQSAADSENEAGSPAESEQVPDGPSADHAETREQTTAAADSSTAENSRTDASRRVTVILLILSGLLALASLAAFFISLSTVRRQASGNSMNHKE